MEGSSEVFLYIYLLQSCFHECLPTCKYVDYVFAGACGCQMKASDSVELEVWMAVSPGYVLET